MAVFAVLIPMAMLGLVLALGRYEEVMFMREEDTSDHDREPTAARGRHRRTVGRRPRQAGRRATVRPGTR
ncbi:hypothetical protein Sfr7A_24070 [Streptomyces xinghaiensis]|uniref:Uncharacterized protein n=1 Tax=Streptomyces xinghaiensis TaxID=1038928 RepID=A0A3R7H719_9ACTN|nr:hypothetical protein Sfr7A_24070 [Streptomyces xinghaiensis]RKM91073.1 hypothetical protein SFRA_030260 [Streptomyces xinghaiensis]RNC72539.1 hypothetical protein DC095_019510 [Streptomyces xinghaiensis]